MRTKNLSFGVSSFCIILFLGMSLISCGPGSIKVKGVDGKEYDSYQVACAAQDFAAAHEYLALLKNKADKRSSESNIWYIWENAVQYVFKQECLYLLSMDDNEYATRRIIFLIKEAQAEDTNIKNNDARCDWLVDLAIDMDKEELIKSLTKLYKNYISKSILKKIVDYLYLQKGEENVAFLIPLLNSKNDIGLLIDAAIVKGNEKLVIELANQYDGTMPFVVYKNILDFLSSKNSSQYKLMKTKLATKVEDNKEMLLFALDNNMSGIVKNMSSKRFILNDKDIITKRAYKKDRSLSDAIIKALSAITIGGAPYPAGLHYYYDSQRDRDNKPERRSHFRYADDIANYNNHCESILNIAIASGNQYLAQKVLVQFREKPVFLKGGHPEIKAPDGTLVDENHSYLYFSDEDKKAAQKRYQEAVRNGAFK